MPANSSALADPLAVFTRSIDQLGEEAFLRLRSSFVVVVGLGGVGSHAAMALARSGVGKLRLIDFDPVTASSLNRNAVATVEDIGRPKTEVLAERIGRICQQTQVETRIAFMHEDSAAELLDGQPDLVIDAIDGVLPKVMLLKYCVENHIATVSSMGASGRSDPSKLRIDDLSKTTICPLARVVRRRLGRFGIRTGIRAVYSIEPRGETFEPDDSEDFMQRGRKRRRLPSLICMPGIFGYALASEAIGILVEKA